MIDIVHASDTKSHSQSRWEKYHNGVKY